MKPSKKNKCNDVFTVYIRTFSSRGGRVPWDDYCDLLLNIWLVTWADGSKELPGTCDTFSSGVTWRYQTRDDGIRYEYLGSQ